MGNCQDQNQQFKNILVQDQQKHLVEHCIKIRHPEKRRSFQQQLFSLSLDSIYETYEKCSWQRSSKVHSQQSSTEMDQSLPIDDCSPIPDDLVIKMKQTEARRQQLTETGLESVRNGEAAVILMVGNSHELEIDTELATYDLGLDSACTIFEILVKRAQRLAIWANEAQKKQVVKKIKIYVMVNTDNKQRIKTFFKAKKYFGYGKDNIFFFSQEVEPVVDQFCRVVLKDESCIYKSTKGSGAVYKEIKNKRIVQHMRSFGVKYVFMAPANNVLLHIADPVSLGHLIKQQKDVVATCVQARDEPFGYFGLRDNKISVCEDQGTDLLKKWASTDSCWMKLDFVSSITNDSKFMNEINKNFRNSIRCVTVYDPSLQLKDRSTCIFFENYYHEAFKLTQNISILQVDQNEHYFPIKPSNLNKYSIKNAREAYRNRCRRLLNKNGIETVARGHVQLDPLSTYCGQNIESLVKGKKGPNQVNLL